MPIVLRLPRERARDRSKRSANCGWVRTGVAIGELTHEDARDGSAKHLPQEPAPVTYVTGDLAGAAESPVYAILQMNEDISRLELPEGYAFEIYSTRQPDDTDEVRDEMGRRMAHHL